MTRSYSWFNRNRHKLRFKINWLQLLLKGLLLTKSLDQWHVSSFIFKSQINESGNLLIKIRVFLTVSFANKYWHVKISYLNFLFKWFVIFETCSLKHFRTREYLSPTTSISVYNLGNKWKLLTSCSTHISKIC